MFSTITNIYNKKNQRTDINGIVHSHRKTGKVFFLTNNRCSMCAPRVNMGASIFFTAATIRAFRSSRSRGNCRTNTRSLTHPQRKKYASNGFPIINFCNPGIHYETPCTIKLTNRKVASSISAGIIGIILWHKILPIALWPLGSTQPLIEMSTRSIS